MTMPRKLLIVSNRLPVVVEREKHGGEIRVEAASGGLITALGSVLKGKETVWIGWPGPGVQEEESQPLLSEAFGGDCRLVPVFLTPEEQSGFYCGFSNAVVWPLFHDLQSRCNFNPEYWTAYRKVNAKFAHTIIQHDSGAECIWIHDYHLILTAQELRNKGVGTTLAYFHHIPFPSPDIFGKLPWRREMLEAMLSFDVLGFQTKSDLHNFVRCLRHYLVGKIRVSSAGERVLVEARGARVVAGAFPISIDFEEFSQEAASPQVNQMAESLRTNLQAKHCILGVDRLDYTKGIPERLRAFELLLKKSRELHRRVAFIQIVVPSREDIPKYQELKLEIEQLVTSINGRYTQPGWVPIQYIYRQLGRRELLAYYRAADIALVTPLKDGMNLVAKEFCAAQTSNEGVLVLSEFAGAAAQLKSGALIVNPNDLEGIGDAIRRAFMLTQHERTYRMKTLRRFVARHDVHAWVQSFWKAIETQRDLASPLMQAVGA